MCYRSAKPSTASRPRSPQGLLLLDFDDIDSTNVFGYKDDRIQNDLLDEICSDIGIKDAIDLEFLDFDGATAACGAEYVAATNDPMFLADDLGDLDQTIPFGQLQREEACDPRPGHVTTVGQPRSSVGCPEFLQQPRSCSADTYSSVMSPMSHSSCHSNQPGGGGGSSSSRNNLLDSSLESIGVDYLGGCGDAVPPGVRMASHDPPSVGSQHGSISSLPGSPRTDYKDCKLGRTIPQRQNSCSNVVMATDMKCSSPCRRDRFGNVCMVSANGTQIGFANGSSHMQYTNIQNLVRSGSSMSQSPGGGSRSQFGEAPGGLQCRASSVSTSQKRGGFKCKLESTFDPGYYSVGSPSVCSGSSIMTAKAAEEAVTRDKVARYLDDCSTQQNYPQTGAEKQLSAVAPCSGSAGMMSSPIKLVHSQPESPQSAGHVAKRARVISSGNELLEEVRECYSYVKGADMFAQARMQPMHPALVRTNSNCSSGGRLVNGGVPLVNGQVNPTPMNVPPMTMPSTCRHPQMMQQQQQMARFAAPCTPRTLGPGYPQHQVQFGHPNMSAPVRTNNSFVPNNSFTAQPVSSYPANSTPSCNFTPVPPSDRTMCSYGAQPPSSVYGAGYQNGHLEKENYHTAAPCQQVPNTNFGSRNASSECQFFGYQNTSGPNTLRYANSVNQFSSMSPMMAPSQPPRNPCLRTGNPAFTGMHAASSMPNLAGGNVSGFLANPSGGSNPALNCIMNDFRQPQQQQHSPKPPMHQQMAPPHATSGTSAASVPSQHGLIQRIISDQTNAFRSHPLFPLLRDLIIADMNFHSPTFPFQLIANLPTDFDKLLQNYLHRNPAAGDGRHGNQAVGKVIEDALRFAHKALIGRNGYVS